MKIFLGVKFIKSIQRNKTVHHLMIVTMVVCVISTMAQRVVFVKLAQEILNKLASLQDSTPNWEPKNARNFVS